MFKSCISRQELSNEYLLAKVGVDTAENGPLKVCQKLEQKIRKKHSPWPSSSRSRRRTSAGTSSLFSHSRPEKKDVGKKKKKKKKKKK